MEDKIVKSILNAKIKLINYNNIKNLINTDINNYNELELNIFKNKYYFNFLTNLNKFYKKVFS